MRADWKPGEQVPKAALVVREAERKQKKDGAPYLVLQLGDRSGRVEAVLWDDADREAECTPGTVLLVKGTYEEHPKYGGRVSVEFWRPATDGEYDLDELAEGPAVPVENLEGMFWDYFQMVNGPAGALLNAVFDVNGGFWPLFRVAPAARRNHEAYRHGLLEHTVQVASTVAQMAGPTIDLNVALAGALLHDVGKVDAYTIDPFSVELTDEGRLFGEIACGFYQVRRVCERALDKATVTDVPIHVRDEWRPVFDHVLHIILSHHGQLEHGSPVRPCTREAALVHAADMLCAQMGAYARLEKGLRAGEAWAPWDKVVRGEAWFPGRDIVVDAEVVDDDSQPEAMPL